MLIDTNSGTPSHSMVCQKHSSSVTSRQRPTLANFEENSDIEQLLWANIDL